MKGLLIAVVLLAACGASGRDGNRLENNALPAHPGAAIKELEQADMALPVLDMTWDPSAYPDTCNSCPPIGTGGHWMQ